MGMGVRRLLVTLECVQRLRSPSLGRFRDGTHPSENVQSRFCFSFRQRIASDMYHFLIDWPFSRHCPEL